LVLFGGTFDSPVEELVAFSTKLMTAFEQVCLLQRDDFAARSLFAAFRNARSVSERPQALLHFAWLKLDALKRDSTLLSMWHSFLSKLFDF
jgi:hypothetical protein